MVEQGRRLVVKSGWEEPAIKAAEATPKVLRTQIPPPNEASEINPTRGSAQASASTKEADVAEPAPLHPEGEEAKARFALPTPPRLLPGEALEIAVVEPLGRPQAESREPETPGVAATVWPSARAETPTRAALSAAPAPPPPSSPRDLDPARLLTQARAVIEAASASEGTGGRELVVRLDPPDLGTMRVTVQRHEGVLSAIIQVAHAEVRDTLHRHTEELRAALADRGLQVGDCQVELGARSEQERQMPRDRSETPASERWPRIEREPWVRPLVGQLASMAPRLGRSLGLNYVA